MGWVEWLVILAVAALLFRPRQTGRDVGRAGSAWKTAAGSANPAGAPASGSSGSDARAAGSGNDHAPAHVSERTRLLAILELTPDATPEDIRNAWRTLVKVWHPDRFGNDPALRERATTRLAAINAAYEALLAGAPTGRASTDSPRA